MNKPDVSLRSYWILVFFVWPMYSYAQNQSISPAEIFHITATVFELMPTFENLSGEPIDLSEKSKEKITVLRFWSSECPHSMSFDDEMQALYNQYRNQIAFFDVNSNYQADAKLFHVKRREKQVTVPLLVDRNSLLAKAFKVGGNAHFLVFSSNAELIYSGAYDFSEQGKVVTVSHIIARQRKGKNIVTKSSPSFGCPIRIDPIIHKKDLPLLIKGNKMTNQLIQKGYAYDSK